MHIGQVIRVLRIQRGLTQEELALEAQVATSNVSRIENGLRQPSQDLLQRLAKALECHASQIYAMCEEPSALHFDRELVVAPSSMLPGSGVAHEYSSRESSLTEESLSLLRYFQQLTPENKVLVLEHIKLLKRLQKQDDEQA